MATETRLSPAAELAGMLDGALTFTALAEKLAGEEVTAEITARWGETCLTGEERRRLRAPGGMIAAWRSGFLRTASGRRVAEVQAVYLPQLIPHAQVREQLLVTSVPLGRALERYHVRREQLDVRVVPGLRSPLGARLALVSAGMLWMPRDDDEVPLALATEWVYASFAEAVLG